LWRSLLDRRIILLDQEPLREEASRAARKTISEIAKLSSSLEEFDKTILPAYSRWESETFGALLEEEAKLYAKIARLESLMQEVAMEAFFTGRHPGDIYDEAERAMEEWDTEQADTHDDPSHFRDEESDDPDNGREFFRRGARIPEPTCASPKTRSPTISPNANTKNASTNTASGSGNVNPTRPPWLKKSRMPPLV
jgi:hypothetical protein